MRDRVTRRSVLVAAVGVVAGCNGESGPTTPTQTPNTDCPPSLTVYEVDTEPVDTDEAVAYGNLTAEQRDTFDLARETSVEGFDYAWYDIDLVAYEGRYYRASVVVC